MAPRRKVLNVNKQGVQPRPPPPAGTYLFKVYDRNTRAKFEICPKLTIKTSEGCQWRCSSVFIVNFEHISHLVLMFLLLTLSR